ncbi:MAG: DUF1549 and DUF1553 domain-containing protein [Planctomycetota bacterium]
MLPATPPSNRSHSSARYRAIARFQEMRPATVWVARVRFARVRFAAVRLAAVMLLCWTAGQVLAQSNAKTTPSEYDPFLKTHWSLQPVGTPRVPAITASAVGRADWARTPVDLFLLEKQIAAGLVLAPLADRGTLIRRLAFDLLGLPPSPDEVAEFSADDRPDCYERLVDRCLAHPRYGERQAQHWLDVVRYAETEGFEYDQHRPGAWRYRDYVIDSLNADKPFDLFTREQIAGDELSADQNRDSGNDSALDSRKQSAALIAVGFHRLGPVRRNAGNSDVAFSRNEVLTEMTDAVGSVFLGLTVGCARCHDHKFDPIHQEDYYRLQAYLASTHEHDVSLASAEETSRWNDETNRIKAEIKRIREAMQNADGQERERLVAELQRLDKTLPPPLPCLSSVRIKADEPAAVAVLKRGQTDLPLATVAPRPLGVLEAATRHAIDARQPRPKSRLADWLLAHDNPLTSRVAANRLWQARFGVGIVATANDFGLNGAGPTHPELLDYLAQRLRGGEWRIKPLQRLLVTSAAYRQSSRVAAPDTRSNIHQGQAQAAVAAAADPENRWLARYPRRRLDAEQLRDGVLAVAGRLDSRLGGPSIMTPVESDLVSLLYKPSQWEVAANIADHHRRSVYLIAKRNLRLPGLELFDQPDLATSCSRRASSTHAPQALELLNCDFANEMALHLARRIEHEAGTRFGDQAEYGFRLVAGRVPTVAERSLSESFLRERSPREFALALLNLNAFLYVD